jgi:putative nucleotidyltransferase with HDIG domain
MNLLSNGFEISPAQRALLWKHAFATSKIASEMAKRRPWISKEEAAVLGLIHDIGQMVMLMYFREQFEAAVEIAAKRKVPLWCVETQAGVTHTQLGKYLASRWAFPDAFKSVIEFHHFPEKSKSFKAEVKLIHLANVLCNSREYPELLSDEATLSCCRDLYISEDEWQEYQDGLSRVWTEVDQLWNLLG